MNPRAFLGLANRLFQNEKNPEGLRSAISRAYYAAFNVAADYLRGIGCGVPDGPQGHELAYNYLNNCGDRLLMEAGGDLHELRRECNNADCKLKRTHVERKDVVRTWVDLADDVIKRVV